MKTAIIAVMAMFSVALTFGQRLAKVQKVNGIEVYVMSEPLRDYEAVFWKGQQLKVEQHDYRWAAE